MKIRRSEN